MPLDFPPENFTASAVRLAGQSALLLGWRPQEFWAATPAELGSIVAAMQGEEPAPPPTRDVLSQLMERFPDG